MNRLTAVVLAVALSALGCASRRVAIDYDRSQGVGRAEIELLPPPERQQTRVDDAQRSPPPEGAPETVSQTLPSYPDSAIADRVACTARLLYHIQTDGSATVVRLEWDLAPPRHYLEAFESAIRDAVGAWEFVPAFQLLYKEQADGKVGFKKRLIPKAGRAVIRFQVEGGRGIVE